MPVQSLPEFLAANPLPEGLDVAGFDALIAGTSDRLRPEIVTVDGGLLLRPRKHTRWLVQAFSKSRIKIR